jgi:hypothetical protein
LNRRIASRQGPACSRMRARGTRARNRRAWPMITESRRAAAIAARLADSALHPLSTSQSRSVSMASMTATSAARLPS